MSVDVQIPLIVSFSAFAISHDVCARNRHVFQLGDFYSLLCDRSSL